MLGLRSPGSSSQSSNQLSSDSSGPPWQAMKPPETDLKQSSSTVGTSARRSESSAKDTGHEIDDGSYEIKAEECSRPPESPNDIAGTYVSIGNEGTTATVTAMGQLMQITRFLGEGRSGFFCVDGPHIPQPRYVMKRAQTLMELSRGKLPTGLGLVPKESASGELRSFWKSKPDLEFIRDGWPRFVTQDERLRSTRQYFVHDHTVLDIWMFQRGNGSKPVSKIGDMHFNANLLIRELDFVSSKHCFNEHIRSNSEAYQAHRLPELGNSIILAHEGGDLVDGVIGLVVSFYVNGEPRTIQEEEEEEEEDNTSSKAHSYGIKLQEDLVGNLPLTVVTAYSLRVLSRNYDIQDISVAPHFGLKKILKDPYAPISFSKDTALDFIFRRTLEHILSVCSIPINAGKIGKERKIALTCGDMSGHRLVNKASFFAFQFLLMLYEFLETTRNKEPREFRRHLQGRIKKTCRAHLEWLLSESTEKFEHCFATNYWATGTGIKDFESKQDHDTKINENPDSYRALSDESLVNTPLQIIKLTRFMTKCNDDNQELGEALKPVVLGWVRSLRKADKRGLTAFPRPGTDEYRLRDHLWIWRALQGLEEHDYGRFLQTNDVDTEPESEQSKNPSRRPGSQPRSCPARDYSSAAVQSKVLQRFTTENPSSKQRMIAVARTSASTRFMIHSRDAALFYYDKEFFSKAQSLWRMTLNAQQFHRENEDSFWNNPLRYAVAVMIGERGFQINSKPPKDMVKKAREVLQRCMSVNGLFAGKIDDVTKEPELFLDESWRDFYWHVGFEVPFILWDLYQLNRRSSEPISTSHDKVLAKGQTGRFIDQGSDAILDRANPEMKKLLPFNTLIDQSSITELADEWLYPYPEFLDFMPGIGKRFETPNKLGTCGLETGEFITEAINSFKKRKKLKEDKDLRGILIDVPKAVHSWAYSMNEKHQQLPKGEVQPFNNGELKEKLDSWRYAKNAKKRLIWMPNANHDTGLLCFLGSPVSERICLASFFDKHETREKFLCDETTAALNKWQTEFHLSWYRLVRECHRSDCEEISFLGSVSKLERAAISFLFIGDFFDRYWTCRVLEYDPDSVNDLQDPQNLQQRFNEIIEPQDFLPMTDLNKGSWRQRKILELLLFDCALRRSLDDFKEIINAIIDELLELLSRHKQGRPGVEIGKQNAKGQRPEESGLPQLNKLFSSKMGTGAYMSFSKRWPTIQYTLQVIEDDLQSILDLVALWDNREKDREPERPRWTKDDERKYRSAITKLTFSNKKRVRQLEERLRVVQSLRASLTNRLDSVRNELSFQSALNILAFTWATFIFFPLGFAAALLSMNGVPRRPELTLWGILAVCFLCCTITAFIVTSHRFSIMQTISQLKFPAFHNRHSSESRSPGSYPHHKPINHPQTFGQRFWRYLRFDRGDQVTEEQERREEPPEKTV